ncbi:hypothetical protein TNCT_437911 [Trichonephila clavata]|uniref:Uncharacterized protein n=1 Tax=Trichonephila clavata TaxID=2740835 RepID=A0A8X6FAX9_TRICU|nr:hypothetical protein TNCT_437911 [Trichonephila clavata]
MILTLRQSDYEIVHVLSPDLSHILSFASLRKILNLYEKRLKNMDRQKAADHILWLTKVISRELATLIQTGNMFYGDNELSSSNLVNQVQEAC